MELTERARPGGDGGDDLEGARHPACCSGAAAIAAALASPAPAELAALVLDVAQELG